MDSLPEQHIDSLPKEKQQEAYWQVAWVCIERGQGRPENEVAKKAGFTSVEDMYFRLGCWGLWGLVPAVEGKSPKHVDKVEEEEKRKPQPGPGGGQELPSILEAKDQIHDAIDTLTYYLENMTYHKQVFQGGRFWMVDEIPKEAKLHPRVYLRDDTSDEEWEQLCSEHGEDPATTNVLSVYEDQT
jgi:hypothetical protein